MEKRIEPRETPRTDLSTAESTTDDSDQDLETNASITRLGADYREKNYEPPKENNRQNPISTKGNIAISQEHSLPER